MFEPAEKLDFKTTMKPLWNPPEDDFERVDVPELPFVMIDGEGDPNTAPAYLKAIEWLYSISYGLKFHSRAQGRDYTVAPLEGLWWADDMADFAAGRREKWRWTMMIMQPEWIAHEMYDLAVDRATQKLGPAPATLRLERFEEGPAVQILHVGPYAAEGATIARLHEDYLPAQGLRARGRHHEIYLGDPRRTAPAKLRTIIRQPIEL